MPVNDWVELEIELAPEPPDKDRITLVVLNGVDITAAVRDLNISSGGRRPTVVSLELFAHITTGGNRAVTDDQQAPVD